jgi:hypothetical protein
MVRSITAKKPICGTLCHRLRDVVNVEVIIAALARKNSAEVAAEDARTKLAVFQG